MEIPNFKSEGQRQAYWKKQRMIELQLDEQNEQKLSKAYHDVDFGVIPAARDNRSIKEIEQDTTLQMINAKKNAMTLMNNDGAEADKLLEVIGKPKYALFNRFAFDIINKLRGQIGKIKAAEVAREVSIYIKSQLDPRRTIPPSADQITNLMTVINDRFDKSNATINDILQRLEAYGSVLAMGPAPSELPGDLPTMEEIDDLIDELADTPETRLTDMLNDKLARMAITQEVLEELYQEMAGEVAGEMQGWTEPAEEETKDPEPAPAPAPPAPNPQPDDDEGEPKGDPKDDEGDDNGDDDDEETIITRPSKKNLEQLIDLQKQWRNVGTMISEISMADESDMNSYASAKRSIILSVADLAEFIGKDPDPELKGIASLDAKYNIIVKFWNANSKKIGTKLEKAIMTINKMGNRESTNRQLLDNLEYRLKTFRYVEFDPFKPEPGKLKNYTAADYRPADLVENAKLYLTLFERVTDEVGSPNVVITRGGRDSTDSVPSASYLYFDFIALKSMAKDDDKRTAKNITLGGLKKQLSDPIYQQTADYIQTNILSEDGGEGKSGSGLRRRSRFRRR
jgi:hypothetical protein